MAMSKIQFFVTYDTDSKTLVVESCDGDNKCVAKAKATKRESADECSEPMLYLSESKITLNNAAIELMNLSIGDRVTVLYDQNGNPVIGASSAFGNSSGGNKLTASNTVSYRGSANQELSKYGDVFRIIPDSDTSIFTMIGNIVQEEPELDEALVIPSSTDGVANVPDIDISELLDIDCDTNEKGDSMDIDLFNLD